MIRLLEFICMLFAIIGNRYVKKKMWVGFVFWTISNIAWFIYAIITNQYFMMLMYAIFLYYTLTSIHTWRNGKDEKEKVIRSDK
jgi:predicted membrane protein